MNDTLARRVMFMPLTKKFFDMMFDVKQAKLKPILEQYGTDNQSLHDELWEELNTPGMENRIANTAIDYLIDCCKEKKDLCDTLRGTIRNTILMSGIFYTNVAPNAACTAEFNG